MKKTSALSAVTLRVDARLLVRKVFLFLLAFELLLVVLDVVLNRAQIVPYRSFRRIFNVARDDSLAGWFSSAQSLLTGLAAVAVCLLRRARDRRREGLGWALIGIFFIFMAADDAAKIHERIGTTFDKISDAGALGFLKSYPSYTWQVTLGPLFALAGLFLLTFLWRQLEDPRLRIMALAAMGCLCAAVGLDFIEGRSGGYRALANFSSLPLSFLKHYSRVLEEFLEMFGTTLFLTLFMIVSFRSADRVAIEFG